MHFSTQRKHGDLWPFQLKFKRGFDFLFFIFAGIYLNSFTSWTSLLLGETLPNSLHITEVYVTVVRALLLKERRVADVIGPDCFYSF